MDIYLLLFDISLASDNFYMICLAEEAILLNLLFFVENLHPSTHILETRRT